MTELTKNEAIKIVKVLREHNLVDEAEIVDDWGLSVKIIRTVQTPHGKWHCKIVADRKPKRNVRLIVSDMELLKYVQHGEKVPSTWMRDENVSKKSQTLPKFFESVDKWVLVMNDRRVEAMKEKTRTRAVLTLLAEESQFLEVHGDRAEWNENGDFVVATVKNPEFVTLEIGLRWDKAVKLVKRMQDLIM